MADRNVAVNPRIVSAIEKESNAVSQYGVSDIISLIKGGRVERATGHAFHFSSAKLVQDVSLQVKSAVKAELLANKDDSPLLHYASYSVLMAVGLSSALIKWNVQKSFKAEEITALQSFYAELVSTIPASNKVSKALLEEYAEEVYHRYLTEARSKEEAAEGKAKVLSGSLSDYVKMMIGEVHQSSLYAYEMNSVGDPLEAETVWGNDYGLFLQFALWCGASFQTTNPPLVKAAWDTYPQDWENRTSTLYKSLDFSKLESGGLNLDQKKVATLTYTVVEKSCLLVRDMYLQCAGRLGFVCYQVNPNHHDNVDLMVDEIRFVHAMMTQRLGNGHEPNISFKIPGTLGGLKAAEIVGKDGISITVTLSFSVFQAVEFGKVLAKSTSAVSSVVIMNGRLAFPVRDHLLELFPEDKETYLKSSELVGVDVTKHLYEKLYASKAKGGLEINPKRVRIMNASLRIYGSEIPDVLEVWGSPSITIFPNVRHALSIKKRDYDFDAVKRPVDAEVRNANAKSEIFRQSWWVEGDDAKLAPQQKLSLHDSTPEAVVTWGPIAATQAQFVGSYQSTKELIGFLK